MNCNELDFELYEFAKDRLGEAIAFQDPSFHDEVEQLRKLNQLARMHKDQE